jgi:hypothetical protein
MKREKVEELSRQETAGLKLFLSIQGSQIE